ncbi:outer membrane protein assembly factor BamC [Sideroxyarcus emersonii]|nr:outer membrane protein assembly factor BamC [Sideroxyarcus emersonii]
MKLRHVVLGFFAASMFAGCSVFEQKPVDYKAGAVQLPPLEVPPDLTVPETEQRYVIPGSDGTKVASYSEYAQKKMEQPCVGTASAPAAAATLAASAPAAANPAPAAVAPTASLKEGNGTKSIQLGEPFDRSWRRVGLALDHARLATTDKDRSKGIYFVAAVSGKDDKKKQADYQVVVRENAEGSEVTVVDQSGKSSAETTQLVETIFQNLDKNNGGDASRPSRGDAVRPAR